jgi:DNA-binding NarL/FixJ family response regulator
MRFVVATHSREVKTALFLALNAVPTIAIVATATSTAELISYCRAFLPDIAIVESGLPGRPLTEVLRQLSDSAPPARIFVIGEDGASELARDVGGAEVLRDVDHLVATLPELKLEEER